MKSEERLVDKKMYENRTVLLFTGLPGSGKTTMADFIHKMIGGARINADQVRSSISTDLKFTDDDRRIQAHRLGALAGIALRPYVMTKQVSQATMDRLNKVAIVDFVCPNEDTYEEFLCSTRFFGLPPINIIQIWMNTITPEQSRFPDTAKIYKRPALPSYTIKDFLNPEDMESVCWRIVRECKACPHDHSSPADK